MSMSNDYAAQSRLTRFDTNASVVGIGGINVVLGTAVTLLLAGLLDQDEYGRYALLVATVRLLVLPTEAGVPQLLTREVARGNQDPSIPWTRQFVAATCILLAIGLLTFDVLFREGVERRTVIVLLAVITLSAMYWCRGLLLGTSATMEALLPDSLIRPAAMLILVAGWHLAFGLSERTTELLYLSSLGVGLLAATAFAHRPLASLSFTRRVPLADRTLARALLPLSMLKGVRLINRRVEILVLGVLAVAEEVAVYNIALQLTGMILLAQTTLNARISSRIAKATAGEADDLNPTVGSAVRLSSAFAAVIYLGLVVFGRPVVVGLLGEDFSSAYLYALVLGAGYMVSVMLGPTTVLLNMSDFADDSLRSAGAAAVLNVVLIAVLIPLFDGLGAAIAASVTVVVIQIQRWFLVRRRLGIRPDLIAALRP